MDWKVNRALFKSSLTRGTEIGACGWEETCTLFKKWLIPFSGHNEALVESDKLSVSSEGGSFGLVSLSRNPTWQNNFDDPHLG